MKEVETTVELDAPRGLVEELLTPAAIIEYEGTYEVDDVGETDDGRPEVYASADNIDTAFAFEELPNGYAYEQTGGEPFEEQYTSLTVYGEDGEVTVTARSEFTFGGYFSMILDWFGAGSRQSELQRGLLALAKAIDEEQGVDSESAEGDDAITPDEDSTDGSASRA
jgi:hypothetical protein